MSADDFNRNFGGTGAAKAYDVVDERAFTADPMST